MGLLTSFSRLGPVYVGAHKGLITGILHDEWGFNGYIITDMVNPASYMTWKESVVACITYFDTDAISELWVDYMTAETNTMWVYAQSNAMNGIDSTSHHVEINTWWRVAYKAVYYRVIALTMLMYIVFPIAERMER